MLASTRMSLFWILLELRMMEVVLTTGAISRAKLSVKSSPPTNQHSFFTGRMPLLSPNQQCQSTEGKNITFHGLAYPKLTWGSYNFVFDHLWLLVTLGRVAMSLVSPLMPVPPKSFRYLWAKNYQKEPDWKKLLRK